MQGNEVVQYYPGTDDVYRRYETNARGERHGTFVRFHPNGQVEIRCTYDRGTRMGPFTRYRNDGTVERRGSYHNNRMCGVYGEYNENGDITAAGIYSCGMRTGPFVRMRDDGTEVQTFYGTTPETVGTQITEEVYHDELKKTVDQIYP